MRPGQRPQLGGQGEGQQEVFAGHLLFELALQPLLALMGLAVRTLAMTAGVRHEDLFVACGAFGLHPRAHRGAALLHRRQCVPLPRKYAVLVLRQKRGLEGVDEGGKPDHLTVPHVREKPFIKAFIRSMAFCPVLAVRCVYFAVVRIEWWPRIFCTSSRSTPASIRWVA